MSLSDAGKYAKCLRRTTTPPARWRRQTVETSRKGVVGYRNCSRNCCCSPVRSCTVSTNNVDVSGCVRARRSETAVVCAEPNGMSSNVPIRCRSHLELSLAPFPFRARNHLSHARNGEANQVIADALYVQELECSGLQIARGIAASRVDSKPTSRSQANSSGEDPRTGSVSRAHRSQP